MCCGAAALTDLAGAVQAVPQRQPRALGRRLQRAARICGVGMDRSGMRCWHGSMEKSKALRAEGRWHKKGAPPKSHAIGHCPINRHTQGCACERTLADGVQLAHHAALARRAHKRGGVLLGEREGELGGAGAVLLRRRRVKRQSWASMPGTGGAKEGAGESARQRQHAVCGELPEAS